MDRIKMDHKMDKTFEEGFEEFVALRLTLSGLRYKI